MLGEVEVAAVGDPLELGPADRVEVLDVAGCGRVVRQLVRRRARAAAAARDRARAPRTSSCAASIQCSCQRSASSGGTKNSISICSNSSVRKMKLPGVISLRNDLPTCAIPNGGLRRAYWSVFLKLRKMPCAVSGRRNTVEPASLTGPIVVSNIRLNSRASVRSQSWCSPGSFDGAWPQRTRGAWRSRPRLLEVVGAEARLQVAAVDQRVGEARQVARGLPRARVLDDRRVEGHHVVALLDHRLPPLADHVVLQQHAVVPVVVGVRDAAVDLRGGEDEAAALGERNDLVHGGHGRDPTHNRRDVGSQGNLANSAR